MSTEPNYIVNSGGSSTAALVFDPVSVGRLKDAVKAAEYALQNPACQVQAMKLDLVKAMNYGKAIIPIGDDLSKRKWETLDSLPNFY